MLDGSWTSVPDMSKIILLIIGYLIWKLFPSYLVQSPLDNIPGPCRTSFLAGNLNDLFGRHAWNFHSYLTETYDSVVKYHGLMGSRGLYIYDPKALHSILLKNQDICDEAEWMLTSNRMVFGVSLLSTQGDHHRKLRRLLNPVFHIKHMRRLTPVFYQTVQQLRDAIDRELDPISPTRVDVFDWMNRASLELIGQGGLGCSFGSLEKSSNAYANALRELVPTLLKLQVWRLMVPWIVKHIPRGIRCAVAPFMPIPGFKAMRSIVNTMDTESRRILHNKQQYVKASHDEVFTHDIDGRRQDIISILMQDNLQVSQEDKLSEEEVLGQMSLLVFAASDTTSNTLARIFHVLAEHEDIQDDLRAEIRKACTDTQELTYDQISSLSLLDAVCRETLRLYPPVTQVFRETREALTLPLTQPIHTSDGKTTSEIAVPQGTSLLISILACNRNPALWGDDAHVWKPARWLSPLPSALRDSHIPGVYSHLMSFIGGGRACLGFKFAELEIKVTLAVLLQSFKFSLSDDDIYWNMGGIYYPTVGKTSVQTSMPLLVNRIVHEA